MIKRICSLIATAILLAATAIALNGGVPSITYSTYAGNGVSGQLQCVYEIPSQATTHPTTWKRRKKGTTTWSGALAVGAAPITISTGSTFLDYEVQFIPTPPNTFTGNPVLVRVNCNQLSTVKIKYQ